MKTFRLIGMALITVLMCANFAACSSDDNEPAQNDDGVITNQKRLTRIKVVNDFLPAIWDFSYDSKGRLIALNETGTDYGVKYRSAIDYTWGDNVITAENSYTWGVGTLTEENQNYKGTYFLNKNLVRSVRGANDENITLTYNSANQLITIEEYNTIESYTWQGEKMTMRTYNDKDEDESYKVVYEYTYSGKTCKGYFPLFNPRDPNDIDGLLFYAHPELIGLRCSQLPEQMYRKSSSYKYTYTFDKDGYVESCTIVEKDLSDNTADTDTTILTFTWE